MYCQLKEKVYYKHIKYCRRFNRSKEAKEKPFLSNARTRDKSGTKPKRKNCLILQIWNKKYTKDWKICLQNPP